MLEVQYITKLISSINGIFHFEIIVHIWRHFWRGHYDVTKCWLASNWAIDWTFLNHIPVWLVWSFRTLSIINELLIINLFDHQSTVWNIPVRMRCKTIDRNWTVNLATCWSVCRLSLLLTLDKWAMQFWVPLHRCRFVIVYHWPEMDH